MGDSPSDHCIMPMLHKNARYADSAILLRICKFLQLSGCVSSARPRLPRCLAMFDERVFANLETLDHLQLYGSTIKAALSMGLSQTSCSRRYYRAMSALFDLNVDRRDGDYEPRRNIDVLADMRQVAQKLRVRRSVLRCSVGWQAKGLALPPGFWLLDLPSMATGQFLTQLEGRLVDVWLGGLLECQPLFSASLEVLQGKRLPLGHGLLAVPMVRWEYVGDSPQPPAAKAPNNHTRRSGAVPRTGVADGCCTAVHACVAGARAGKLSLWGKRLQRLPVGGPCRRRTQPGGGSAPSLARAGGGAGAGAGALCARD